MEEKGKNEIAQNSSNFGYALGLHKFISSILGIWPLSTTEDIFSKARFLSGVLLQFSMLISLIADTFTDCYTIKDVGALMTLAGSSILSLAKLISLRCIYRSKMAEIIISAMEDWSKVEKPEFHDTMKEYAKMGRFVLISQMSFAYSSAALLVIGALPFFAPMTTAENDTIKIVNETFPMNESEPFRGLPLTTICIFPRMTNLIYYGVFIIQSLQLLVTCTGNVGNDVFFFGITMYICSQFQLLNEDLKNFSSTKNDEQSHECLVTIVKRHRKLNSLAQNIEDSFNFILLLQLSANASQMCMMGIQMILSLKHGDVVMIINTIIAILVLSIQLFVYSYAGDLLSSQMKNLALSAYLAPWHNLSPLFARDVLFVITRSQKAFNLTGGKVYRIDIENFKNLIKALGSYFSVLRVMFDA